jgi:hypothetical protein
MPPKPRRTRITGPQDFNENMKKLDRLFQRRLPENLRRDKVGYCTGCTGCSCPPGNSILCDSGTYAGYAGGWAGDAVG